VDTGSARSWQPPRSRIVQAAETAALDCIRRGRREDALELLMAAYGSPIAAFALRVVRDRELAKDVRQQVFLDAFQGISRFEGRSSLWSWLCSIAYHRCLDELRRVRRAGAPEPIDVWDVLAAQLDPASDDEDRLAQRRALEACMAKLSDSARAELLMRCFLGLSFVEISALVGASHGTLQVRMSRILPRLRRCLRGQGVTR
jgi:RNA polymerase sigma-70 factor (ECF subfamily)